MQASFTAGEASRVDAARAAAQAQSTHAELAGLRADARAAAVSLAVLTSRPPEARVGRVDRPGSLPSALPDAGVGLRSELLRRRPDVRQAERDLAAATADVAVATADLFPRLSLMAGLGQQSRATGNWLAGSSARYQVGPSLSWPVFAGGRIRAEIRAAGARSDLAASRYEKAVLTALADSETALNRYAAAGSQRRDLDAARVQSAMALNLTRERYAKGEDDLFSVLDAEAEDSGAEQAAVLARAAEVTALASLYKALGGGWESPP
jgi:outer membrane protein TolC